LACDAGEGECKDFKFETAQAYVEELTPTPIATDLKIFAVQLFPESFEILKSHRLSQRQCRRLTPL